MRRALGLALLVLGVPVLQGALTPYLPRAFRPDLALLVLLGLSIYWRNAASGLVLVAACGLAMDFLAGGLLGQRMLLWVLIFGSARMLSLHVNLVGFAPQMLFAAGLTAVHALGLAALTRFFTSTGPGLLSLAEIAPHAAVNAVLAPLVSAATAAAVGWLAGEESGRRLLRLEPRGWAA